MEVLTPQEMASFLEAAKESKHYAAFVLELATGLRRGELLALRWGNIDFKKGTLTVKEQLVRADEGLIFKGYLKTQKSRRGHKFTRKRFGSFESPQKTAINPPGKAEIKTR